MSKTKKKAAEQSTTISEEDIKLVKIIEFAGWVFLILVGGFMAVWLLFDYFPDFVTNELSIDIQFLALIDITVDEYVYAFLLFTGTSTAICFALSAKINKNLDQKKELFLDWLVGEFLFAIFAIIAVAVYQW